MYVHLDQIHKHYMKRVYRFACWVLCIYMECPVIYDELVNIRTVIL